MKIIENTTAPAEYALMGSFSIWHWLIVLVVVLLLFGGGGKIPKLMKDLGTGVKSFKKGLKDEDKSAASDDESPKAIEGGAATSPSENKDRTAANG